MKSFKLFFSFALLFLSQFTFAEQEQVGGCEEKNEKACNPLHESLEVPECELNVDDSGELTIEKSFQAKKKLKNLKNCFQCFQTKWTFRLWMN